MLSKKQTHSTPWPHLKIKETPPKLRYSLFCVISLTAWLLVLFSWLPPAPPTTNPKHNLHKTQHLNSINNDETIQKQQQQQQQPFSVYVYNLPSEFNLGLLQRCQQLNAYTNMCPHVANHGLGQPLNNINDGIDSGCWFATHQFIAEMIFHARLESHPLRTWDPSRATLFYVPFYGGLHASSKFRESNLTAHEELAVRLTEFHSSQPWWQRRNGEDHFVVLGRTAWDFMRKRSGPDFGANSLLNLPRVQNMSVLTVERNPWRGSNQHGIPYPSYFHPSTASQMLTWQNKMRQSKRPHLLSFIGAPRKGVEKAEIRDELIRQCAESSLCKLMTCKSGGASNNNNKCYEPSEILRVMTQSRFCLQAPGDSFTRRSTFDTVLAGCIPVFFSPHTAYTQYAWFLPTDPEEHSVYLNGEKGDARRKIEDELLKIPRERVERMRNKVIDLIPRVTYKHPTASDDAEFQDAVDVALAALASHVQSMLGRNINVV